MGQLLLKLRAVKVEYRLDQLNNKHTKIVNSAIQCFEGCSKKNACKKFFGPPTTKWRPCKVFAKLNGNHLLMANTSRISDICFNENA